MPKRIRHGERYLLAPGEWLPGKERYRVQAFLGQGAFGAAYKATNAAGQTCFIKEFFPPRRPAEAEELTRVYATERDVVRRIGNYELIPRFWDAFEHDGFYYLVTDFIPGPDLEHVLKSGPKPEMEVLIRWCVCLCHELAYLHSRNVVHHDLKPSNIRLNEDGDPVLVDFGAAHWYRQPGETTDQLYGSDSYLAPEYLENAVEDLDAGKKMDVFAMGRILIELIVGKRMSQEEINRRQEQLYGEIMHSGRIDVSFLRAVFRSVAYDPTKRYASAVELDEEITPAAPPLGRVRPKEIDFGLLRDTTPKEIAIQCYNAGGGTLHGEVAVDAEWLEVGASGATTGKSAMFERNRQTIRLIAYPDRISPGSQTSGRVVFTFQNSNVELPVIAARTADAEAIQAAPRSVQLNVPAGSTGRTRITFSNLGGVPATVRMQRPADLALQVDPLEFVLPPRGKQDVQLCLDASVLGDRDWETALIWFVEEVRRPDIPLQVTSKRGGGLLTALTGRFRKN